MRFRYFCILIHCLCLVLPAARGLDVPHETEDAGEAPPAAAAAGVEEAQDELEAEAPRLHAHQLQHEAHGDGGQHQPGQVAADQLSSAASFSTCIMNSSGGVSTWSFNNLHMDNGQFKTDKLVKWYFEKVFQNTHRLCTTTVFF